MSALVSVIIAVYNGERFLAAALQSVLGQDYPSIEIIVVDDGSTDGTADVARSFAQVRYEHIPHAGVATALNYGIQTVSGDYFCFLDADDLWTAGKLSKQMQLLDSDASLDAVFGYMQEFQDDAPDLMQPPQEAFSKGTMLIRRSSFRRVGPFDPQWQVGDFIEWFIRASDMQLKYVVPQEVFLKRRLHGQNMGTRERDRRMAYLQILKQAINRRTRPES